LWSWYKSHTAPIASRQHSDNVLKTGLSEDMHFSKTTNGAGALAQELVNTNNTSTMA